MNKQENSLLELLLQDWQRRLTLLFSGLFLLQFVFWIEVEKDWWLPETVQLVKYTLLLTFLIELLPRFNALLRILLQFIVLLALNALFLGYHPVGGSLRSVRLLVQHFYDNFMQLTPYVWFSFAAWLIYRTALWWVQVKWRITTFIIVGVVIFAVRDSFSQTILWDKTAMMIFCGLCLLVIHHFHVLKRKNPHGWAYLAEYPVSITVPVILIITFTMVLGIIAPNMGNLLTDPYTLYKNWKGESIDAYGKGNSFFLNGNSSSGYSRNDQNLGGSFEFDNSTVMTVDTTHRSYWRGETRSFYNGTGWEMSETEKQSALTGVAPEGPLLQDARTIGTNRKTVAVKQTFTIEKEDGYPVLFGAFSIQSIDSINSGKTGFERLQWSAKQAELKWPDNRTGRQSYPKQYTLVSQMLVLDEKGLRTASQELPNRAAWEEYLQLPANLPNRVKQLAQQLTQGATNPYDKAKSIEQYLQKTYPYTNKPDAGSGKSKDFVDRFLFEIREGYCDYYSSAMAVLARSAGIPSRWVKGYAPGFSATDEFANELPGNIVDPDGAGIYTVRNADAHSWVELYISGWGWVPFEPTAGFVMPSAELPVEVVPVPESDLVVTTVPAETLKDKLLQPIYFKILGGIAIVVIAVWLFFVKFRSLWSEFFSSKKVVSLNQRIVQEYNKLVRYSKRKGFIVYDYETARETIQRWKNKNVWLAKDLEFLLLLFEKAKYGSKSVTMEEFDQATTIVKKLREEM